MTPEYDTSSQPRYVQSNSSPTNMIYDPEPHPLRAGADDPILWVIDPIADRVELKLKVNNDQLAGGKSSTARVNP